MHVSELAERLLRSDESCLPGLHTVCCFTFDSVCSNLWRKIDDSSNDGATNTSATADTRAASAHASATNSSSNDTHADADHDLVVLQRRQGRPRPRRVERRLRAVQQRRPDVVAVREQQPVLLRSQRSHSPVASQLSLQSLHASSCRRGQSTRSGRRTVQSLRESDTAELLSVPIEQRLCSV